MTNLANPARRRKRRTSSGGQWQPDLFGGRGIQRTEGLTRAEQLELARQEMRDTGSRDLFDAVAEQRGLFNPSTRGFTVSVRAGAGSSRGSLGRTALTTVTGPDGVSIDFDGRLSKREAVRNWRYQRARRRGASIAEAQRAASNPSDMRQLDRVARALDLAMREAAALPTAAERERARRRRDRLQRQYRELRRNPDRRSLRERRLELAFMQGRRAFNLGQPMDATGYVGETRTAWERGWRHAAASAPERNPRRDSPELRYQRAVGHGETVATARTAARNPGRATGRTTPNCPTCGALVRLPNPVPPRVRCHQCGSESMVRRP